MEELKTCAFCGSIGLLEGDWNKQYKVFCSNGLCGASSGPRSTEDVAVIFWNQRPSEQA